MKYLDIYISQKTLPEKSNNYKLYKLGNIVEKINERSQKSYVPDQELSIDGQMVGANARISILQYMLKNLKKKINKMDSN